MYFNFTAVILPNQITRSGMIRPERLCHIMLVSFMIYTKNPGASPRKRQNRPFFPVFSAKKDENDGNEGPC